MEMEMRIYIDFREIAELSELHEKFKEELGFPDFYGMNVNALIDCLQSMRFPEDGMSKVVLEKEQVLILDLKNLSNAKMLIVNSLLVAVESVNQREIARNRSHSIILSLS